MLAKCYRTDKYCLNENMDSRQQLRQNIHEELSWLRLEMNWTSWDGKFKELEKGIDEVWATIEDLKEESSALKAVKILQENETQLLRQTLKD